MKCPDCGHVNLPGEEDCSACHAPIAVLSTPQPKQGMQKRILEGSVRDLQPHDAANLGVDATLEQAVKLMREKKVGCVLVMKGDALAGILTERDLLLKSDLASDISRVQVADVMRPNPECIREEEPLAYAFNKMSLHGMHHLAVRRSDGRLAVVSARDLLRYLCE
ncbi:MAG: CBS domain-containing protein [Elusimicrobia bacterium]|nr:CBS domain-containing protein [Elusimicrobiota bacterium]